MYLDVLDSGLVVLELDSCLIEFSSWLLGDGGDDKLQLLDELVLGDGWLKLVNWCESGVVEGEVSADEHAELPTEPPPQPRLKLFVVLLALFWPKVVLARAAQSDEEESESDDESDWGEQALDDDREELKEQVAKSAKFPLFVYTELLLVVLAGLLLFIVKL